MTTNVYKRTNNEHIVQAHIYVDDVHRGSFLISSEDESEVRKHTWARVKAGYVVCVTHPGELLHRLIMNPDETKKVDHINHQPNDNTRPNLRVVTHQQNMWNRKPNKGSLSPVRGVFWTGSSWGVEITKGGSRFKKSGFDTMKEAMCYRIRREYEMFGENSMNYRNILYKMPRELLLQYFPEIFDTNLVKQFVGSDIHRAHYKQKTKTKKIGDLLVIAKNAGATM